LSGECGLCGLDLDSFEDEWLKPLIWFTDERLHSWALPPYLLTELH
jgi:hypothetical protein